MRTALFVCTGNTCRSPLAEAIAQHWIDRGLLGEGERWLAVSAGVGAVNGARPALEAVRGVEHLSITLGGRAKPLSAEMIRAASVVFCMTAGHLAAARALVADSPGEMAKIVLLDPKRDIEDPLGMGQEAYDVLVKRFMELVPRRLKEVLTHEDRARVRPSRD